MEEERRLAYVGMTRAKQRLFITHAANRRIYNQWQTSIPSRFIGEIPEENVDKLSGGVYGSKPSAMNWAQEVAGIMAKPASSTAGEGEYKIGTRIFHQKFGYGRITAVSGNHLDIAFEKAGEKKVLADFVSISA